MKALVIGLVGALALSGAATSTTAAARPKDRVVYQTVMPAKENSFFDITTLYHPQLGQSLRVARPMTWKSLEMGTNEVKVVRDMGVYDRLMAGGYDENWFTSYFNNYTVTADVTIEIWRQDAPGPVAESIDLAQGFTRVYTATSRSAMKMGARVTFRLGTGVAVTPGSYFITIGARFVDPRVFNFRFTGQENGTNTLGGYDHSHPVDPQCANYKMTKDAHPGGQAYRSKSETTPQPPLWQSPFTTKFEAVDTKVIMPCDMRGNYDPNDQIWNPGDITMVFRGTRG